VGEFAVFFCEICLLRHVAVGAVVAVMPVVVVEEEEEEDVEGEDEVRGGLRLPVRLRVRRHPNDELRRKRSLHKVAQRVLVQSLNNLDLLQRPLISLRVNLHSSPNILLPQSQPRCQTVWW
jgi:hypothetical protein